MPRRSILLLLAGLLLAAAPGQRNGLKDLQGTWTVVSVERDGKMVPPEKLQGWTWTVQGDKYTFQPGDQSIEGTYRLDQRRKPWTIEATRTNGPEKGTTLMGIYRQEGDTLTICFSPAGKTERPSHFASPPGSGLALYVLKRAQP
ncbi:MAG: TIGR03067 domain-containing protein [Planctomycetes bacterium]|nr:TIGR03067 domain-containing protein [Planctomycetota bacterium]